MILPLPILLLVLDTTVVLAAEPNLFSRAHEAAARHTKNFARDLRITFGALLQTRSDGPQLPNTRVVYCRSNSDSNSTGNPGNGGGTGSTGTTTKTKTRSSTSSKPQPTGGVSTPWKLVESHEGKSFFEGWDFWDKFEPTHGMVDYVNEDTARSNGLLEVNDQGNAIMRVETTPKVDGNRKSVRLHSKSVWNGGLFILDVVHMPQGCGSWGAFWTNGPNWPTGGEIDIIEGVNDHISNQATVHTAPGCRLPTGSASELDIKGSVIGGLNCAAFETGNQGCGIRSPSRASFGAPFNQAGGGVFALQWDDDGISVYFFPRDEIPDDILSSTPQPKNWGKPEARWPASTCDPHKFFYEHIVIINETICGDWSGEVWNSTGILGQEESCAARTGYATCVEFARNNGGSFTEAYWEIRSMKMYSTT